MATAADELTEELHNLALQEKLEASTVIKVDGIPEVPPKVFYRFQRIITDIFTRFGKIRRDYYPKSENGHTTDCLFVEYEEHKSAVEAVKQANNYQLSEYTLLIQLVSDCENIATLLKPLPGYDVQYFSRKPTPTNREIKHLNSRIQDWMNDVPPIPDLEKHKMMESIQLVAAKKKIPRRYSEDFY